MSNLTRIAANRLARQGKMKLAEAVTAQANEIDRLTVATERQHELKIKLMNEVTELQDRIAKLEAVVEAAKPCAKGCRRCDGFERQYRLQDAISDLEAE